RCGLEVLFGEEASVPGVVPDGAGGGVDGEHAGGLGAAGGVEGVVAGEPSHRCTARVACDPFPGACLGEPAVGSRDGVGGGGDLAAACAVPAVPVAAHHPAAHHRADPAACAVHRPVARVPHHAGRFFHHPVRVQVGEELECRSAGAVVDGDVVV